MIRFTDILLGSPLPLHPRLLDHSRLSVGLIADGEVVGETQAAKGDLETGIWDIPSSLQLPEAAQQLTLAVVAHQGRIRIQFASATYSVKELISRVEMLPDVYQDFNIGEACPGHFLISCLVETTRFCVVDGLPSQVIAHGGSSLLGDTESERQSTLGVASFTRFEHTDSLADINSAAWSLRKAVEFTPDGHPNMPGRLKNLGGALCSRFERTGSLFDIEDAVLTLQKAVEITPDDHPEKPNQLLNLGGALNVRFDRLGSLMDIEDAISSLRMAVDLTPDGHPNKPSQLNNLGGALAARFGRFGSPMDIADAASSLRKAVELTPDGHPNRPGRLNTLGSVLIARFERFGGLTDIEDAISSVQKAVELTSDGYPDKPNQLSNLGGALLARFERLGSPMDIADAAWSLRKAVELTPEGHPNRPGQLSTLGSVLIARFERIGNLMDIEEAILSLQKAVEVTPNGHPNMPGQLSTLGGALLRRFECTGIPSDIEDAVLTVRKAVEITPDNHPEKPNQLLNLGGALKVRFDCLGSPMDIEEAISSLRKAVELTPDGHPNKPGQLSTLGSMLIAHFERFGSLIDVEDAISSVQRAVELTSDGHPNKPSQLSNLGSALKVRFECLGSLMDIEDAISSLRKAVELTPDGHPNKAGQLSNLGITLCRRFERTGSPLDIEDAIFSLRKAVELTSDSHSDKPDQLSKLGVVLCRRFERTDSVVDIEEAISNLQKAVEITPDGHPHKPNHLCNLGGVLDKRFERTGSLVDINSAILSVQKAVEITPDGHPDKPERLCNLGRALRLRFEHSHGLEDLEGALQSFSRSANLKTGHAMTRFKSAYAWAKAANANSQSPIPAFSRAIDLLPQIGWLGLTVTDQHALLAKVGGVVREAVATAIQWDELETAVEWAEQGRSIAWQNMLSLRTPVDELQASHPLWANRVRDISRRMEASMSHDAMDAAQKSSKLAIEWENMVEEIRQLAGFDRFLRAKTFGQLSPAAHEGPVVILNVDTSHCDALVLIADDSEDKQVSVINIPLNDFSYELGQKLSEKLNSHLTSAGVRARGENRKTGRSYQEGNGDAVFNNILRVLWLAVVKPVIDALAYQAKPDHLSRIWWCATGSLAFLPIHAAGIYCAEREEKLSDYVVSSYTPTLTAILDLSEPTVRDDFKILTVAQPSTPYATPIPKTEEEIKKVQNIAGDSSIVKLTNEEATVERVLRGMRDTDWIHLACHGRQCAGDPMKSGLLLHDKILELSVIVKQALPRAELAFLSACQTATGDERIADESVHLAAGMLLAGYRGVIATMWSIKDSDAPQIAEDVYRRILRDGRPNRKEAAYALHDAVKRLRDSGAGFMSWVPFIHIGR